jgi:hypothetical protein
MRCFKYFFFFCIDVKKVLDRASLKAVSKYLKNGAGTNGPTGGAGSNVRAVNATRVGGIGGGGPTGHVDVTIGGANMDLEGNQ